MKKSVFTIISNCFQPKISVLDAINYVAKSWRSVICVIYQFIPQTIANCWRHAGFVNDVPMDNDESVPRELSDVVLASVTGRAEFEADDSDVVCTNELDYLELAQTIVAMISRIDEESETNEDSDELEELPASQVKHSEAKRPVSLL